MKTEEIIEEFIRKELVKEDTGERINPDESLVHRGIIDSLALLLIQSFLEEQFGVSIDESELKLDNFQTINDMKSFVESKLQA